MTSNAVAAMPLSLTLGNVQIVTEIERVRTTTVFVDGVRVGFVQHTTIWAGLVLDQEGTPAGGWDRRHISFHWPLQANFNAGQIPAAALPAVREMVAMQREAVKAADHAELAV